VAPLPASALGVLGQAARGQIALGICWFCQVEKLAFFAVLAGFLGFLLEDKPVLPFFFIGSAVMVGRNHVPWWA
jgi:hypothetical protein